MIALRKVSSKASVPEAAFGKWLKVKRGSWSMTWRYGGVSLLSSEDMKPVGRLLRHDCPAARSLRGFHGCSPFILRAMAVFLLFRSRLSVVKFLYV